MKLIIFFFFLKNTLLIYMYKKRLHKTNILYYKKQINIIVFQKASSLHLSVVVEVFAESVILIYFDHSDRYYYYY